MFTQRLNGQIVLFLTIWFNISHLFAHSLKWSNSYISPIDRILSGATTLGQSVPGSNGIEGILYILQSSKIGALPLDCLVLYPGYSLGGERSYPSAEIHSMYSTAPANLVTKICIWYIHIIYRCSSWICCCHLIIYFPN